jgi:hypothetical protein
MAEDNRDAYLQQFVKDKTFIDVGGLWGLVNEKVTVAHDYGAISVAMMDIWKPDDEWWVKFRERYSCRGIPRVDEIYGSVDNSQLVSSIGRFDVVHASGLLYHCPNPVLTLRNLHQICGGTLILATAVMPPEIENEYGRLVFESDAAYYVPALSEPKRRIVDAYIKARYGGGAYGVNEPIDAWFFDDGHPNYGPWWWLWSASYVQALLDSCGFEVIQSAEQFGGTGHLFACRTKGSTARGYSLF